MASKSTQCYHTDPLTLTTPAADTEDFLYARHYKTHLLFIMSDAHNNRQRWKGWPVTGVHTALKVIDGEGIWEDLESSGLESRPWK